MLRAHLPGARLPRASPHFSRKQEDKGCGQVAVLWNKKVGDRSPECVTLTGTLRWQLPHTCERRPQKSVPAPRRSVHGGCDAEARKGGPSPHGGFGGQHGAWLWPGLCCAGSPETTHSLWSSSSGSALDGRGPGQGTQSLPNLDFPAPWVSDLLQKRALSEGSRAPRPSFHF